MSEKWRPVIRQILLRGNFIAGNAAAVAATYETAGALDDTVIIKSGGEYSFLAIVDSILQAMTFIVAAIGENRESEYRAWFRDFTNGITSGDPIPTTGSFGGTRYGRISNVKDIDDDRQLTFTSRTLVAIANRNHGRRKLALYQYFTDDVVIEHTRTSVKAEIVSWDREAERTAMVDENDTADCPLPDKMLPVLEFGALAFIYRDTFNAEQAVKNWNLFYPEINAIAGKQMAQAELPAKQ